MNENIDLSNVNHLLHVLRNPYGWNDHIITAVMLKAADKLERLINVEYLPQVGRSSMNNRLDNLLTLQKGWDGYDAPVINERAVAKAKEIACLLPGYDWQVVPCSSSGLQLENHTVEFNIEIIIEAI